MHEYILIEIGQKLRKIRKEKGLTVQTIAARAGVSKGLISRIENSRTVPSLPVLISVVKSLDIELNTFFSDIDRHTLEQISIKRSEDLQANTEESHPHLVQYSLFNKNIPESNFKSSIVELKPKGQRRTHSTSGYAFHYILTGNIHYKIGEESHDLISGDSLYFDARLIHSFHNSSPEVAKILVMDFAIA